ncbi:MAG: homoserine dehydrogenase, partial [Planctomycetales bacterium]|nr:homoserine dehydrogenase [Planctomycetales bacterium]
RVVVRDVAKAREADLPAGVLTDDLNKVLDDPEIEVVAQVIGGLEPARTIMLQLLEAGKDVVTANKALLAEHGPELFDRARELGRSIAFEASVAGGIPIVCNISQCLSANQITSVQGILNGTSNFIISQMEERGADYERAVREAQELGYAEADPTMDVDGSDAAQKLAILAHLAFGARVRWTDIPRAGIDKLDPKDLRYASELGYRIKLLAVARLREEALEMHVSPTLVRRGRPLAEVREAYNAVRVDGDAVGSVFFHGLGAGQMPTASAVVADMIDTAVGRTRITFRTLELWSERESRFGTHDYLSLEAPYYLRFTVADHPGVLSQITGRLGAQGISIASVIQHEAEGEMVPLVIRTHKASEGAMARATEEIERLPMVHDSSVRMRVLD